MSSFSSPGKGERIRIKRIALALEPTLLPPLLQAMDFGIARPRAELGPSAGIHFLIGGGKIGGAEKRMLLTAALLKHHAFPDLRVTMRQRFHVAVRSGEASESLESALDQLEPVRLVHDSGPPAIRVFTEISSAMRLLRSKELAGKLVHCVLFKPLRFPELLRAGHLLYEVPAHKLARKASILQAANVYRDRLTFLAVSPSVGAVLRESVGNLGMKRPPLVLERHVPFAPAALPTPTQKENLVVFGHRLIERKHPWLAFNAMRDAAIAFPNWQFEMYGQGQEAQGLAKATVEARLNNFRFMGYTHDLETVLSRSSIFLSLISPDNYPSQSVLEAMRHGNALLLSDTGVSRERFLQRNGVAAELDQGSVTKVLLAMLASDNLKEWGRNSRELFKVRYSEEAYLNDSLRIYQEVWRHVSRQ